MRQLDCFIHVCDVGSITRAARDLNIAQPALGLQIRGLEHYFGANLLTRSFRGVTLTPEGEEVLRWARAMRSQTEEVRQRLREMAGASPQALTIALSPALTNRIAGDLVEQARARFPDMQLKIAEGMSYSIAEWVENQEVDIGIASGPFETESVEYTPALIERLFYICRSDGEAGPITLAKILKLPLALPAEFHSVRSTLDQAARTIGMQVQSALETASVYAALDLASHGIAGAIGPYSEIAKRWSGDLSVRLITEPVLERTLYIMRRGDRRMGKAEGRILSILRGMLAKLGQDNDPAAPYRPITHGDASQMTKVLSLTDRKAAALPHVLPRDSRRRIVKASASI